MKVSPEARRLAKEKNKELSVATLQFDVTFCTAIPCAPSLLLFTWPWAAKRLVEGNFCTLKFS